MLPAVCKLQFCFSVIQACPTLCNPMDCSTPGFPVFDYLLELAETHVCWVGDTVQPSHPLLCTFPLAFSLSQHQCLFPWVDSSQQVGKELELHFCTIASNEYSELISFRSDWLDLLAVRGTLRSVLQHHSSKASILHHLAFFMVQLLHSCMTPGITIPLIT